MPLWSLLLVYALALLSLLHFFLLPSVRWFFRRRANRVIDEVNDRLALQLPSFKLTKREVLIDRLVYHPEVMQKVEEVSQSTSTPRDAIVERVRGYAREIVPAFNAWLYFKWAYWLARRILHTLFRVRLGFADDASLADLKPGTSVVFVMNHRSNMDYIIATYLAAERTALSYAVGEWARVWPLQQLIRAMGGYFVRRDSGDPLYRQVLQCYVQMAAAGSVPQAVFPEGRLSRDGRLGKPKLGLLGYITKDFDHSADQDIVFIPVGINYDRVFEDRTLLRSLDKSRHRATTFFTLKTTLWFVLKNIGLALSGRWYRYGYACVNFGTPVSLKEWQLARASSQVSGHGNSLTSEPNDSAAAESSSNTSDAIDTDSEDREWQQSVSDLAEELMAQIGQITPILPVALVTTIFSRQHGLKLSELQLKSEVLDLIEKLSAIGAHVYIPRNKLDYAVTVGVRMLTLRHILIENDGYYHANDKEYDLLDYYAASIEHLVARIEQSPSSTPPTTLPTRDPAMPA